MNRREFIEKSGALSLVAALAGCASRKFRMSAGGAKMSEFRLPPMDEVRFGFVGLNRGRAGVRPFSLFPGTRVTAICDLKEEFLALCRRTIDDCGRPPAHEYTGSVDAWKKMADDPAVDVVIVGTPINLHSEMANYFMEHGKHVAVEVPAATTVEECWRLVETSERTGRFCMLMENCCYGEMELMFANAVREGTIGELLHAETGYIHDCRNLILPETRPDGTYKGGSNIWLPVKELKNRLTWRGEMVRKQRGNSYPTHGLGPVAQMMNVNRGDRFLDIYSVESKTAAMAEYAREKYGAGSVEEKAVADIALGDHNTSLIRTAGGKTIRLDYSIMTPRPYCRISCLAGTRGALRQDAQTLGPGGTKDIEYAFRYALPKTPEHGTHAWSTVADAKVFAKTYEHPLWRDFRDLATTVGGHGGMDFLMFLRMAYCLRRGLPLDQDVYDLATWSSLVELSEKSVKTGFPVEVPDFTRGAWKTRPAFDIGGVDDAWRKDFEPVSAHVKEMSAAGKKLRG